MQKHKKLTAQDLAFGIGRKATKKELKELFNKPLGKLTTAEQLLEELRDRNASLFCIANAETNSILVT